MRRLQGRPRPAANAPYDTPVTPPGSPAPRRCRRCTSVRTAAGCAAARFATAIHQRLRSSARLTPANSASRAAAACGTGDTRLSLTRPVRSPRSPTDASAAARPAARRWTSAMYSTAAGPEGVDLMRGPQVRRQLLREHRRRVHPIELLQRRRELELRERRHGLRELLPRRATSGTRTGRRGRGARPGTSSRTPISSRSSSGTKPERQPPQQRQIRPVAMRRASAGYAAKLAGDKLVRQHG